MPLLARQTSLVSTAQVPLGRQQAPELERPKSSTSLKAPVVVAKPRNEMPPGVVKPVAMVAVVANCVVMASFQMLADMSPFAAHVSMRTYHVSAAGTKAALASSL